MSESHEGFIRSAGVISALTFLSRVLGLARDAVCAGFFGAGMVWDAFSFAFRIPNLFRRLFGEGALSAAFVPLFSEQLELKEREEAWRMAGSVAGSLALLLGGILVAGEAALIATLGLAPLGPRWHLTLLLTALMLPYMVLICLAGLAGAALNSLKHFAAPALAPVVLNVVWILAVVLAAPMMAPNAEGQVIVVSVAVVASGVLQLLLQLAALHRRGFRWRLSAGLRHPEVRRVGAAMAPVALGLGVLQINVLLDGVLAISLSAPAGQSTFSLLGLTLPYPMQVGANSVLYYGNRLMQFPLGVFGIALATAAFPTLSRLVARRDWEGFSRSVVRGLGAGLFVALPASVGLILLSRPLTALVFERGEFTALMTARTADVIAAYSVGMWAYFSLHMLTRAFYSLGRQGTPAVVGGVMVAVNLVLNLALVWPLREAGLAAATSVSAMLQVVLLLLLLSRHVPLTGFGELARGTARTAGATACMAAAAWAVLAALGPAGGLALKTARVLLPAAAGAAVYAGAAAALGSREMRAIWASLRPKRTAAGKAGPADETKAAA